MKSARAAVVLLLAASCVSLTACSQEPDGYPTDLLNDSPVEVAVTGCPDCGGGQAVAAGDTLHMTLPAGQTDLVVSSQGKQLGCFHAVNDVTPAADDPPQQLTVSTAGSCSSD